MKTLISALMFVVVLFSTAAFAEDYGWKELTFQDSSMKHLIGMTNRGDQGGEVALICNTKTHKLNMTYNGGGKQYDLFVFRKFGVTNVDTPDTAGKFLVGMEVTTQADVYYNVLNADKAFAVARFPVGTKAIIDKAIAKTPNNLPVIEQEGDEFFVVGNDWKNLLGKISKECPVHFNNDQVIF